MLKAPDLLPNLGASPSWSYDELWPTPDLDLFCNAVHVPAWLELAVSGLWVGPLSLSNCI